MGFRILIVYFKLTIMGFYSPSTDPSLVFAVVFYQYLEFNSPNLNCSEDKRMSRTYVEKKRLRFF